MQLCLPTRTNAGTYGIRWQSGSSSGDTRTVLGRVAETSKRLSNASEYLSSCCWTFPGILTIRCCLLHMFHVGGSVSWDVKTHFFPSFVRDLNHSPIDYPWGSEVVCQFPRAQDTQGVLNTMMQSKVILLRSAFPSQAAPNSTEVSAVFMERNTACKYLNFCVNMGLLGLVINVKHKVSILNRNVKELDSCMYFTGNPCIEG